MSHLQYLVALNLQSKSRYVLHRTQTDGGLSGIVGFWQGPRELVESVSIVKYFITTHFPLRFLDVT